MTALGIHKTCLPSEISDLLQIPTPGHVTPLQQVIPHTSKNIVEKQEALVEEPAGVVLSTGV